MFDWQKLAPSRCYLCGLDIASGQGDREHFIPRALFERGKLPNEPGRPEPLPSHIACNRSTSLDEARMAITWATVRPVGFGSAERWDRAMRALKRPMAAGLKASFLDNIEELASGGARLTIPNESADYVSAKMVRGIIYRETGHVYGTHVLWFLRMVTHEHMVKKGGVLVDFPGAVTAKYLVSPNDPDVSMCFLAIHGLHIVAVFTFPASAPLVTTDGSELTDAKPLPWPRIRPHVAQ